MYTYVYLEPGHLGSRYVYLSCNLSSFTATIFWRWNGGKHFPLSLREAPANKRWAFFHMANREYIGWTNNYTTIILDANRHRKFETEIGRNGKTGTVKFRGWKCPHIRTFGPLLHDQQNQPGILITTHLGTEYHRGMRATRIICKHRIWIIYLDPGKKQPTLTHMKHRKKPLPSLKLTASLHLKIGRAPKGNEKVFQRSIFGCFWC